MSLQSNGQLIAEKRDETVNQPQNYSLYSGVGRSVLLNPLNNDAVYYLHGNQVLSTQRGVWE